MRVPIVCALLLTIALGGCGVSDAGMAPGIDRPSVIVTPHPTASTVATPTFDQAALQEHIDHVSNEATVVGATVAALHFDPSADPAVATVAARRSQDNFATLTALQPTMLAFATPLAPRISDAASTAASAAYGAGAEAAAVFAASALPVAGQSADEAALLQQATIIAATIVALHSGAPVEPAVATEATRRYQDNIATLAAFYPTSTPPPLPPTIQVPAATPVPTPDIQSVPVAPAPAGLAGVVLPATQEAMAVLFREMPASIAGQDRGSSSTIAPAHLGVVYGTIQLSGSDQPMPRIFLIGTDQGLEPSTPGWTGAHVIAATARQSPDRITAWGRDNHLYWLRVAGPVDPSHINPNQMLLIGSDTSTWVFQLIATSPEELDALAAALAEALARA